MRLGRHRHHALDYRVAAGGGFFLAILFVLSFHHGATHMTWLASNLNKEIIQEIEAQTDRAAALIAAAYLEERLRAALDARTCRYANVENEFYRSSGPLGSFSARIDLALLLGIIEPQVHKFLHTIKDIRNAFAHQAEPRDFDTQRLD